MIMSYYFHGTFWSKVTDIDEAEDAAFFDLDTGYSDLDVVFVTNLIDTAHYFSNWNRTSDHDIQVVLRGELLAENLLTKSTQELQRDPMVEIDGEEFNVGDREEFFTAARRKYDGFNIQGNYAGGGDDIALFSGSHFNAMEAKFLIDGNWTEWMDRETARNFHKEICGLQEKSLAL
jgi:hypothetical protein